MDAGRRPSLSPSRHHQSPDTQKLSKQRSEQTGRVQSELVMGRSKHCKGKASKTTHHNEQQTGIASSLVLSHSSDFVKESAFEGVNRNLAIRTSAFPSR